MHGVYATYNSCWHVLRRSLKYVLEGYGRGSLWEERIKEGLNKQVILL